MNKPQQSSMPVERRTAKRRGVPAATIFRTAEGREGSGVCVNLAVSGILFRTSGWVPGAGSELWVYFKLSDRQFLAAGRVVWTAGDCAGVSFQQEPYGLKDLLELLETRERRDARRVAMKMLVRIRRESSDGEPDIVEPVDLSGGGFGFQSVHRYTLGETVRVALHYNPAAPETAAAEAQGTIVRAEPLPQWDAFSYGVQFNHGVRT